MSERIENFIKHLITLKESKKAMAFLRRSLGFKPGCYVPSFPYIEPFINLEIDNDPYRIPFYLIAGLFALYPFHSDVESFATVFGKLANKSQGEGVEKRFIALLGTEFENLSVHLRYAFSLINQDKSLEVNFIKLAKNIRQWQFADKDRLKEEWARDFYRAYKLTNKEKTTIISQD